MARIEDTQPRADINLQGIDQVTRDTGQQSVGLVMYPRGGRVSSAYGVGQYEANIANTIGQLVKFGTPLVREQAEKQDKENFVRGQMLAAQGKTKEELLQAGESTTTMQGYRTMQAATAVQAWQEQHLLDIEREKKKMSPDDYREELSKSFSSMLTDDEDYNLIMTAAAAKYMPALTAQQMKANSAYTYGETIKSYTDLLVQTAISDGDIASVIKSPTGLSTDDQQKAIVEAAARAAERGNTRLLSELGVPLTPQGTAGQLGHVSAQKESGGNAATIGYSKTDGRAFGTYQIAEKPGTFDSFLQFIKDKNPDLATKLANPETRETEWRKAAAAGSVQQLEYDFHVQTHYSPAISQLNPELRQRVEASPALQEAMFSTAVQHGSANNAAGAGQIANKVWKVGMTDADFLTALYEERKTRFPSSTPEVRASVQRRLDDERKELVTSAGGQLTAAQFSTLNSKAKELYNTQRQAFTFDAKLSAQELLLKVQSGAVTPEAAQQMFEDMKSQWTSDSRYKFGGYDISSALDLDFRQGLLPAQDKAAKVEAQNQKISEAVRTGNLSSLEAKEIPIAWGVINQQIVTKAGEQIRAGMTADEATAWADGQWELQAKRYGKEIDKKTASEWTNSVLGSITDAKGIILPEAKEALQRWTSLSNMSPGLAAMYITDTKAADIMYTAAELYRTTPDAQYALTTAKQLIEEGKNIKDVVKAVSSPEVKATLNKAVDKYVNDIDPGIFSDMFGSMASSSRAVWDEEIQSAIKSPIFNKRFEMQAGLIKMLSPSMPDKAVAKRATADITARSEFVLGSMVVQNTPGSIQSDMGLQAYQTPLTVNEALLQYLKTYGGTDALFGKQWDTGSIFNKSYYRGVPQVNVRYSSQEKLFYVQTLVDRDTGEMSLPLPIPAKEVGDFYKSRKATELELEAAETFRP